MANFSQLIQVLKKRYEESRLASLYIVHYDSKRTDPNIWAQEFLSQMTVVKNDHPDVLTIKREEDEKNYRIDGPLWTQFQSFIQYKPLTLKNKFVFVHDAHKISDILSNKLLKTFEDSPNQLTIFLFLKDQQTLLPTILSRGINLQIQAAKHLSENYKFSTQNNPTKIIEEIKALEEGESQFVASVITDTLKNTPSYQKINELLEATKSYETYAEYNNSLSSRIALILP